MFTLIQMEACIASINREKTFPILKTGLNASGMCRRFVTSVGSDFTNNAATNHERTKPMIRFHDLIKPLQWAIKFAAIAVAVFVWLEVATWHTGCTTLQRQKAATVLSSPQAKYIESAGAFIATIATADYAPEFAPVIPLAMNAASGLPALLNATSAAQAASVVQDEVNQIANIPAYKPVADQINNALKVVNPKTPQERVDATQALAQAISENLPK